MATYTLTPARRAALRKAQLASAAKRRRGISFQNKSRDYQRSGRVKKGLKYAAVGLGTAAAVGAAYGSGVRVRAGRDKQKMTVSGKGKYFMGGRHGTHYATVAHSRSGLYAGIEHTRPQNRFNPR